MHTDQQANLVRWSPDSAELTTQTSEGLNEQPAPGLSLVERASSRHATYSTSSSEKVLVSHLKWAWFPSRAMICLCYKYQVHNPVCGLLKREKKKRKQTRVV